ncbi:cation diffusion facilitator family transporter [Pontibacter beigongshangensis]|uniref:cation diffusion facilitator family transporter n=1 Tax=Pontibacter beigongshangensis TaxID=2574733 RepID=UPI00164FA26D|nr:cation diffusion facilitator family transporter [Pontibacter beigongshangensis]
MLKGLSENIRLQMLVVTVGGILLVTKFVAYFLTNSNAILTDALESVINVVAGLFSLYSLVISARPKDENHPYGHGKIEFIASSVEGSLIIVAGVFIIIKSIFNFFNPVELRQLDLGILLITMSGVVNFATGYVAEKKGRDNNSMVLVAGGRHLKTDAYSTAGILVGLLLIYLTRLVWLDSIVAVVFGGIICYSGLKITRTSVAGIMDEADYDLLKRIVQVLNDNRRDNWIDIHNLRVIKYGAKLHIDCHLTVPWYLTVLEAHDEVDELSRLVRENIDPSIELFIHTDPCVELSCTVCGKSACSSRKADFRERVEWEFEKVIADKKHGLQ